MAIDLRCDSCEFGCSLDDESRAYRRARDHELEYPPHNVLITGAA